MPIVTIVLALAGVAGTARGQETARAGAPVPVEASPGEAMKGVRRIVFTGNSLTDGSAWCDWVVETLEADGHPDLVLFNAGVAGNSTAKLKARYRKDVLGVRPDLVVINVGSRDGRPAAEYRRDMGEMVRDTLATGAKVLLMTPAPLRDPKMNELTIEYSAVVRELAAQPGCILGDTHAAFASGRATGRETWGPDGVHHTIDGWRAMARCVLDALGCHAAIIERTRVYPHALTEWYVSPPVEWKAGTPVVLANMPEDYDPLAAGMGDFPQPPEITAGFDPLAAGWRRFDREAEIAKTSWWQRSWLERGGVMPMGQDVSKEKPGAQARGQGAWSLAIVNSDEDKTVTMHVGGSLPYAVWLNGRPVWKGNFLHGYHPSADRIELRLRKGENHVLTFTNWLFYVSIGEI
jgi:lysophospholipase L1-like esterase